MSEPVRYDELYKIAYRVRKWAQCKVAKQILPETNADLCGMCAIATVKLSELLTKAKVEHECVLVDSSITAHCFVLVGDWIVDVTATQFNPEHDMVCIINKNSTSNWYWRTRTDKEVDVYKFNSSDELIEHQIVHHWPKDQIFNRNPIGTFR